MVARNVWFSHLQKAPSQAQVGIFTEEAKQCRGTLGGKIQKESGKSCHPFFARFSGNWLIFVEHQDYEAYTNTRASCSRKLEKSPTFIWLFHKQRIYYLT